MTPPPRAPAHSPARPRLWLPLPSALAALLVACAGVLVTASLHAADPPRAGVSPTAVHAAASLPPAHGSAAPASPAQQQAELDAAAQREHALREALERAQARGDALQAEVQALQERQRIARSQLLVAESTLEHLTSDLAQAHQEISKLRQSVAFYERLIPDGNPTGRVSIRSAELYPLGDGLVQYRVLVMRHGPTAERFEGELQFVATGKRDDGSATIPLERLANAPISTEEPGNPAAAAVAGLSFRQYQRASGLLAIPSGFIPVTITVRVLEGKAIRAEHTITLAKESLS